METATAELPKVYSAPDAVVNADQSSPACNSCYARAKQTNTQYPRSRETRETCGAAAALPTHR